MTGMAVGMFGIDMKMRLLRGEAHCGKWVPKGGDTYVLRVEREEEEKDRSPVAALLSPQLQPYSAHYLWYSRTEA